MKISLTAALLTFASPVSAGQLDWNKVELPPAMFACLGAFNTSDYAYGECRMRAIIYAERVEEFKQMDVEFSCEKARNDENAGRLVTPLAKSMCDIRARAKTIIANELEIIRLKYLSTP